jgi:hypothetical protein
VSALESFHCNRCDRDVAPGDIKRLKAGSGEMLTCAACGGILTKEQSRVVRPIAAVLATAFSYPFRPMTLGVSLAVSVFAGAAGFLPFGGLIGAGIRFGWLFAILRTASLGGDDVEVDPSEISSSLFSWMGPALRVLLASLVAFLPAIVAAAALGESGAPVAIGLGLIGLLYLPAALIVAAHDERWLAPLNPAPAVALITRIPGSYFVACAMLLGLFAFSGGAVAGARTLEMPFVGTAIEWVLGFLPLVAAARMLGILVYEKREEL